MDVLYVKIKDDILDKITSGVYEVGQIIPTEIELSQQYEVSRPTIRQAIQILVNEGYLEKRKKRGTIVCSSKIQQEFTQFIESFDSEMSRKGRVSKTKVITLKKETANEEVVQQLQLEDDKDVFKLVRLRYVDEQPNVLVTTYVPSHLFSDFLSVDFTCNSLYGIFQQKGYPVQSIRRKLETIKADETVADLLDVCEGDPLFYFHSLGLSKDRIPVEYSISKYRGDINSFVFELTHR